MEWIDIKALSLNASGSADDSFSDEEPSESGKISSLEARIAQLEKENKKLKKGKKELKEELETKKETVEEMEKDLKRIRRERAKMARKLDRTEEELAYEKRQSIWMKVERDEARGGLCKVKKELMEKEGKIGEMQEEHAKKEKLWRREKRDLTEDKEELEEKLEYMEMMYEDVKEKKLVMEVRVKRLAMDLKKAEKEAMELLIESV